MSTAGIVVGLFMGEYIVSKFGLFPIFLFSGILIILSMFLFLLSSNLIVAYLCRIVFGHWKWFIFYIIWVLTYLQQSESVKYEFIISASMSARPLAPAFAVPLLNYISR